MARRKSIRPGWLRLVLQVQRDAQSGCWDWTGPTLRGRGVMSFRGQKMHASRAAYLAFVGAIPPNLELDHLCCRPICVSPNHLEPVTQAENMRRRYADYTTCRSGHPFDDANTYIRPEGHRQCRACNRAASARLKARRASAA